MENDKKDEAPKVDTPQSKSKSLLDSILDAVPSKVEKPEEKKETPSEAAPKAEVSEESKKLQETLSALLKEEEGEVEKMKALLPNTKDESKKLEIERSIFEKEKKIYSIKKGLTPVVEVIDLTEVDTVLGEMKIDKSGEAYKLVEKMKSQPKGAQDLVKMFVRIAKAIAADAKKSPAPAALEDKPKDVPSKQVEQDNGIVAQIARSLNK